MKKSYNREVERAHELTHQLDNAKRVNRLSQVPLRPVADYMNTSRYSSNASANVYGNVEPSTSDPGKSTFPQKSPSRSKLAFLHGCRVFFLAGLKFSRGSSSDVDESRITDGSRKNSVECSTHVPGGNEPVDSIKLLSKKKGRMECAESGQLRSTQSNDADISSSKIAEKDARKV